MTYNTPALELRNVYKSFRSSSRGRGGSASAHNHFAHNPDPVQVISGLDLILRRGDVFCITGQSGSGKSTLLHIAGLLSPCDSGDVIVFGNSGLANEDFAKNDSRRTSLRRKFISFIYQFHHLLLEFNVMENLVLPQRVKGIDKQEAEMKSEDILSKLGIEDKVFSEISSLSGGERQRVAIARALVTEAPIILADEPTGNLDPKNAASVFDLFSSLAREMNRAALIVTHDTKTASYCDKVFRLDGQLTQIG